MVNAYGEPLNLKQERSYLQFVTCMPSLFRCHCCLVVQVPDKVPEVFGARPPSPEWDAAEHTRVRRRGHLYFGPMAGWKLDSAGKGACAHSQQLIPWQPKEVEWTRPS